MKVTISIFIYILIFYITNRNDTIMPDESIVAVLNKPLKIPVDSYKFDESSIKRYRFQQYSNGFNKQQNDPILFYKTNNNIFPILYQDRHSGLGFYFFKFLYSFLSPLKTILVYHISLSIFFMILSFLLLKEIIGKERAEIFVLFYSLHPFFQIEYAHNISEQLNKFFILFVFYFIFKKKFNLTGFLIGTMIINKLSTIFCVIPYFMFLFLNKMISFKDLKKLILPVCLTVIPYIYIIDLSELFLNRSNIIIGDLGDGIIHYPYKDAFNFIFNPINFHGVFFDDNFILGNIGLGSIQYWIPSLLYLPFIFFTVKKSDIYGLFSVIIPLGIFTLLVQVIIPNMAIKSYYFNDLMFMFGIYISYIYVNKKDNVKLLFLMLPMLINWTVTYNNGLNPLMSYKMYENVVNAVKNDENIFIIGEGDLGVVEFLTKNKKETTILAYENFKSYEKLLEENKGTFIIYSKDVISEHYWRLKDHEEFFRFCNIRIGDNDNFFCIIRTN